MGLHLVLHLAQLYCATALLLYCATALLPSSQNFSTALLRYCSTALLPYCQLHILAVSRIILSTILYVVSSTISTALLRYCSTANFTKFLYCATALLPTSLTSFPQRSLPGYWDSKRSTPVWSTKNYDTSSSRYIDSVLRTMALSVLHQN